MQIWAHVKNGVVDNIIELEDNLTPGKDVLAPEYAIDMFRAPDGTVVGSHFDGKKFSAPPPPAAIIPDVDAVYALIQLSRTNTKDGKSDLLTATRGIVEQSSVEVQVWFERAQRWMRQDQYVAQVAKALELSDSDIDNLFVEAAKIPFEKAEN